MTVAQIKRQVLDLDPAQRLRLVQDIWDSLVKEPQTVQIPKQHRKLVDQRVAEHDANPATAITLAHAKAQIRGHFSKRRKK
jgi:putative addiction module component (TIGR02574 family)